MPRQKPTETSRAGSHSRERNRDHPIAQYCREAVGNIDGGAAAAARQLRKTAGYVSQLGTGTTHPSVETLITLSLLSNVSLGRLSTLAASIGDKTIPTLGEIEGRIHAIPEVLRQPIFSAIKDAEALLRQLPPSAFSSTSRIQNQRLVDLGWKADDPDERGAPPESDADETKRPRKR